jgi:hypothetical protein
MTAFQFTTGNPNNLVGNQNASMVDIQGPFVDLRSFLNGGSVDETNVPNLSAAFTTYKPPIVTVRTQITNAGGSNRFGTYLGSVASANPVFSTIPVNAGVFYLDPADFNANTRTTKLQLRAVGVSNAVAPGQALTAGLYLVSSVSGTSGNQPLVATTGTVLTGSTAAVSPIALGSAPAVSGDFNCPAAGNYVINVTTSGAIAAGSVVDVVCHLYMRQV